MANKSYKSNSDIVQERRKERLAFEAKKKKNAPKGKEFPIEKENCK